MSHKTEGIESCEWQPKTDVAPQLDAPKLDAHKKKARRKKKDKKPETTEKPESNRCLDIFATMLSFILVIITFPISLIFCLRTAKEYEKAVILRLGKKLKVTGPGIFFFLPCVEEVVKIDMRTKTIEVSQEVLTKDYVNIRLDGIVYYRVEDPLNAAVTTDSLDDSTALLAASTFRCIASLKSLGELLSDKNVLSIPVQSQMEKITNSWGAKIEKVLINHIYLPPALQRALATEAEANREARAKIISAEAEKNAAYSLKEASDIISESPGAMQLRYLQTLNSFPSDHKSTIIFPMPIDLMSIFTDVSCTCATGSL